MIEITIQPIRCGELSSVSSLACIIQSGYELFADEEAGGKTRNVQQTTIAQAFPKTNSKMTFV